MSANARVRNAESSEETKSKMRYLDDEREAAAVVVVADWCVAPGNNLAVNFSGNGDVLANGKPEHILRVRKLETITAGTWVSENCCSDRRMWHTWPCWVKLGFFPGGGTPSTRQGQVAWNDLG